MVIKGSSQMPFQVSRFDWSLLCGKVAERDIYTQVLKPQHLERPDGNKSWLDRSYGVDVLVTSDLGRNFAIAERFRGQFYQQYQDLTVRYESLQTKGKILEIDKSIARVMLYGYADTDKPVAPTRIVQWIFVDLQLLLDKYHSEQLKPVSEEENDDDSSTFLAFGFEQLEKEGLVLARSQDWEPVN